MWRRNVSVPDSSASRGHSRLISPLLVRGLATVPSCRRSLRCLSSGRGVQPSWSCPPATSPRPARSTKRSGRYRWPASAGAISSPPLARFEAALRNRRFRSLLLAISGVPIAASYLWNALLQPLLIPSSLPTDFHEAYVSAATAIATGQDPYG